MIEVELPDGTIAEFPDGTPRETITGALRKRFGGGEQPDARNSVMGKIDSVVRGAADFLTLGLSDEISAGMGALTGIGGEFGDYSGNLERQRSTDRSDADNRGGYRLAGQLAGGLGGGLGLARSGLSMAANAANAGQGLGRVALASGVEGAALGGAHGFGSGEGARDRLSGAASGAAVGGVLGAATPLAVAGATEAAKRVVSPFRASPERLAAAQTLRSEGVPVTAGQLTGNRRLRFAESELGGRRAADIMDQQADAFTSAVLRRAGINANRATPEVVDDAFNAIGQRFDELSSSNSIVPDSAMLQDLRAVFNEYGQTVPESMRSPIVENVTKDIVEATKRGSIGGEAYQNITSRIAKAARGTSNPDLRNTLYGIRGVLDDAMERSIAQTKPAHSGMWREAREQYRNLLAVEQAATRAGEQAAEGVITPSNIRNAAVKQGRRAYARGKGDFADLARAGSMLLSPLPDSGTAGRLTARNLTTIPTAIGGVLGGSVGNVPGGILGAAAGAALPRVAGAALMSKPGQAYFGNQLLSEAVPPGLLSTLINSQTSAYAGRRRPLVIDVSPAR